MRTLLKTTWLLLLSFAATACVSTAGPDAEDLSVVEDSQGAIALVRVIVTSNLGAVPPFDSSLEAQCVGVGLSDREANDAVKQIDDLESFSEEALAAGWLYLVVPPGKSIIAFDVPEMWKIESDADRWAEAPHWQFEVPQDTPTVYLGTMQLHCRAEASDFGARLREVRAQRLHDESVVAVAIGARFLPDLPPPVTVLPERLHERESTILRARD